MIRRILAETLLIRNARGTVSIRQHDQPVHLLDAPSALGEFHGQPIQQLRMSRRFSLPSEIIRGLDNSFPKVTLPNAVHHHAAH